MDENQQDVKEGEEQPVEPSTTEEPTGEAEKQVEESAEETTSTEAETVEGKGANQRIRELNQRAKTAEAKAQTLEQKIAEITGSVEPQGFESQYKPQVQPGEEISPERYQQDIMRTADGLVTLRVKQAEAVSRIRSESQDVVRTYPQLDPKSDQFDPELSETVTEAVEAQVRANPYSASVSKFVDKLMKPYTKAVANEVGKERENIAKQVSQSALRPTSVRKTEKTAAEMPLAELEAKLGITYS